ncbi:pilus assembly protein [Psychromonas aquimarina]|uniref:pilus assembly protein n=1 Tax=Psychromonas aquimarina TaxID=444919 RepID=UPI00040BEB66|nr:PilC/PilY family type IV pilus protein [Psychromonas aquimarina]
MKSISSKKLVIEVIAAGFFCTHLSYAAPLDLTSTPLVISSAVDPNMMLLLDSSGSMSNIVPDLPYDTAVDYRNCNGTNILNPGSQLDIRIQADGDSYFSYDGSYYDYGNDGSTGITGRAKRCFVDAGVYTARLLANGTGDPKSPSGYLAGRYSGNYLNWYFADGSGNGANFGAGATQRAGTNSRMEIAKKAAAGLISGLDRMRVGLSIYDGESGADGDSDGVKILVNIGDVDSQESTLITEIAAISNSGSTPLGESLEELGRYFTLGYPASSNLKMHPGLVNEADIQTSTLFSHTPEYKAGLSAPAQVTQYWCQQNYIVAMSDGRPQADQAVSADLHDYDGDCVGATPACGSDDKKSSTLGYEYESSGTDFADDVALAMYDIDLRPDLSDGSVDIKNNVTTYMVGFADDQVLNDPLIKDIAANGGGKFLTAADSLGLVSAFRQASESIFAQVAAAAAVSFNTSQLSSDSGLYQASFNTAGWRGSLKAFSLSDTGVVESEAWDAADILDNMTAAERKLFSYSADTSEGIEFTLASLSAAQLADLRAGPDADADGNSTADDDDVQLLINYIRGDDANEGSGSTNYRVRSSSLGDIVNSTALYVGAPQLKWPDYAFNDKFGASGADYSTFKSGSAASRTPMLYVGANDGMLHGFNAALTGTDAGKEKFAYLPGSIASAANNAGLHYLAELDYQHRFYVDLSPAVSDVYINRGTGDAWRTVLIGGLRGGGKGLFALDITDPTEFASPSTKADEIVLWEFSSADDIDLGYTYSQPTIVMTANGKWAAIVGNGYNNSGDGHAKLFIIFIEEGVDGSWDSDDYIEIDTGIGDTTTPNGLSTPRVVDIDGDNVADRVYAGDLQGNMWAFDLSSSSANQWQVAYKTGNTPKPLFTARNSSNQIQPITTAPIVSKNPNLSTVSSNEPNLLVFFGVGKYLEANDVTSNLDEMSYYSVLDANEGGKTRTDLTVRELLTNNGLRAVSGSDVDWNTSFGWYFDLVDRATKGSAGTKLGERVVSESLLRRKVLFFNTVIPDGTECSSGGKGWLMALDLDTGLAPYYGVFDANNDGVIDDETGEATVLNDLNHDGVVDDGDGGYIGEIFDDGLPSQPSILEETQYTLGSTGVLTERKVSVGKGRQEGRLSWEEQIRQ